MGSAVPGLCYKQNREAHEASRPPDSGTSSSFHTRSRRHRRPLLPRPRVQVLTDDDRSDNPVAGSSAACEHHGRNCSPGIFRPLGLALWGPGCRHFGLRGAVYLGDLAPIALAIGDRGLNDVGLPPASQWTGRAPAPHSQKRPPLRKSLEQFLDAFLTLGDARPSQRAEVGHGRLGRRNRVRHALAHSGFVLPGRTINPAIGRRPARPGQVQRCVFLPPNLRLTKIQGLAIRCQDPPDRKIRVRV